MEKSGDIAVAYVQRQEQLLVEYIRKTIQLEVSYNSLTERLFESQKNNEHLTELNGEISRSLELITVERNDLKKSDTQLRERITEIQKQCDDKIRDIRAEEIGRAHV